MVGKYFLPVKQLPLHPVVSFIHSVLKQEGKGESWEVTGPGHTAEKVQDWDLNLGSPSRARVLDLGAILPRWYPDIVDFDDSPPGLHCPHLSCFHTRSP